MRYLKKNLTIRTPLIVILFLSVLISKGQAENILKVYSAPAGVAQNKSFAIKVRVPGGKWQDLPVYLINVDKVVDARHAEQNSSMAYFDFSGTVEVAVTYNKGTVESARIRPLSYNIQHQVDHKTVFFKLNKPANISVEINGNIFDNLHLFANPLEEVVPGAHDPNVIFFGPGYHQIAGGRLVVPSGKTVYIAGGAVVDGQIVIQNVTDVKVLGRGMLTQEPGKGVKIAWSKNVLIEGIFCGQCFTGGSENVTIKNIKSISYWQWGDGMNVVSSNNVLFDGVFNRNSDDCTTVYGSRGPYKGGCKNVVMKNSTLWADVAHPILIGTHGSTPKPVILEDLTYENLDILDHMEFQYDYQGCMSLNAGDSNLIRNVRFENIRVEDFRHGQLLNLRVFFNSKYCTSPGRGIENVIFKNVSYKGSNALTSIIAGYDDQRTIKNIVFDNLRINGQLITDKMPGKPGWYKTSDMAGFFVGEHVSGISFVESKD
ncbi:glycosyl hydrolase family 28 [Mucilaginibacter yixingensis]|uniref:Glycosyl hydrolase family 28 n=1 Tax=Mucilaginibacter yixingensis TaxID=1295612 RepID=A0A2T5J607_9SPHI|nr:glycosyl hydrolase family 28 [Mucilaginibacter yixingensis]